MKGGQLIQKKPAIYQDIDGKRVLRKGNFKIRENQVLVDHPQALGHANLVQAKTRRFTCSFQLAAYSKDYPLIIDPVLVYSTYLGGSNSDWASGIAVDNSGNAYVTGITESSDFPTKNALYPNFSGGGYAFVTKINASGTALVYSTFLGGNNLTEAYSIAVDGSGNAYVTGWTYSSDFPTKNPLYPNLSAVPDAFVTKINPNGTALVYSTYLGGSGDDEAQEIAVDSSGNAYVTGWTGGPSDFPTKNPLYPNLRGVDAAFVTKINAGGTALVYSTYLGGSGADFGGGIAVDSSGNAYVTGWTYSSDFPTKNALYPNFSEGGYDAFVTKINAGGTALIYSTYLGGSREDYGHGIAVDSSGNAYVTGETYSSDFPVKNPLYPNLRGYYNAFVTKINAGGTALVYSTYLGGSGGDGGYGIAVDSSGNAYVTGLTYSSDFPTKNALYPNFSGGGYDAFVTKINASGTALVYSTYLGGSGDDNSYSSEGIAVDGSGNAYVTGETESSDFPTKNPLYPNLRGYNDAFVTKISGDTKITLTDAILALQVSAGISPAGGVQASGDVNGDGRIGLEEAIYDLQYIAGLR